MKNQLLKGTLILSGAGILTRILGFIYRIFLSGTLGEVNLGIYQLIFPVYSLCFTLYGAGIQTAISQMISHEKKEEHNNILKSGLLVSFIIACFLSFLLYTESNFVATSLLGTKETANLLRVLALIFPFCGITSVINGYFYGINDAKIPAITQIIEQLCRVSFVCIITYLFLTGKATTTLAVAGLLVGEIISNFYNLQKLFSCIPFNELKNGTLQLKKLISLALPLSANKLTIALLGSFESVLIPVMLMKYGYSKLDALAIFGILTGVVLPFIMFPGTLTNSLSVLLLPTIAEAAGKKQHHIVQHTTSITLRYSLLLGVITGCLFLNFGIPIGAIVFKSENAGKLLTALSFLCPFLYASTTLSSVINGLGKTGITFLHTILSLAIRLLFLFVITPQHGIYGYLLGVMTSQIIICILNSMYLVRMIHLSLPIMNHFIWPSIFTSGLFYCAKIAGIWLENQMQHPLFAYVFLIPALIILFCYLHCCKLIEWKTILPTKK